MAKETVKEKELAKEMREKFLDGALENASPEILAALLLSYTFVVERAGLSLQKKISAGNCNAEEIREWIPLFASFRAPFLEKQTKDFYEILQNAGHEFSSADLEHFVLAFKGIKIVSETALTLMRKFLRHDDTSEEQVLKMIEAFVSNRKSVFAECRQNFKLSFAGCVRCLVYPHAGKDAMKMIESMKDIESLEFDRAVVKQHLFEATENIHVVEKAFGLLSRLEMFEEKDFQILEERTGMMKLVAKARQEKIRQESLKKKK